MIPVEAKDDTERSTDIENPVIVFLWKTGANWPVEFVSDNIEQFGYTVDDFLSGDICYGDIVHPEDRKNIKSNLQSNSQEEHREYNHRYRIITKNGNTRWVAERSFVDKKTNGVITHYQGLVMDITDEVKDKGPQGMIETISTDNPVVIFIWKTAENWPVKYVSDDITQFGYNVDDFISGSISYGDIVHPNDLKRVESELQRQCEEGKSDFYQEYQILTRSGDVRQVAERTHITRDRSGKPLQYEGIIEDLSNIK
ncbi:MAG: PAS domain-containing protein [Methanosarcinaceae archaeon]|nr:PAS domain-containing protein [Methanosarcinaceae archaeon]